MARIDEIERRLLNWARWRAGGAAGGLGYASVNLQSEGAQAGYREAVIPTIDCEAEETERAVMSLASELRAAVEAVYLQGGTSEQKARRLCVTPRTVQMRVETAHRRISAWLADLAATRRLQRERIEAMQRAARP